MSKDWDADFEQHLKKVLGAKKGKNIFDKYHKHFPTSYKSNCKPTLAEEDIQEIEKLSNINPLVVDLYTEDEDVKKLHVRLYQLNEPIPLSDILPILENLDLRTLNEQPYELGLDKKVWISDFTISYHKGDIADFANIKPLFQETLLCAVAGTCENDGFNKLVLGAGLAWQDILILRAYTKYLQQAAFRFSQPYIEKALNNNPDIAKSLIQLFKTKLTPKGTRSKKQIKTLEENILTSLDKVKSLDEDRILRRILALINATLRTNYFQTENGSLKPYLSFKLASNLIPELPLPHPLYEIFVYSPRFEAIHLRATKVARGGIRWSDRREDFRTEILGLMKAQKVKNAVIVPSGAKGGFVLKKNLLNATRAEVQEEVISCYKSFMRGLLDLTDNIIAGKIVRPKNVFCIDDADPYFVVAADKGTSTFSDIANSISKEFNFWLGDAFASGGSAGYDHKEMGITARGAWESIKRHFAELHTSIYDTNFTMVGIGDMSGDVFGNGLLYTKNCKLVAAFDHRDIFLDPNPNPDVSYKERKRLFKLPASSWQNYNPELISVGGGVYSRTLKSIAISKEVKKVLGIEENSLTPSELIRAILKAPVDLLYNGGIGTFVKASSETHIDVGDKANEFHRVNGNELRCKIVGEGGNLGFTQLGRVEYALNGGLINTDFIDNSAGVDCSDHEVNIKILLDKFVNSGKLAEKKRNELLFKMTNEVADLVLKDNYNQALVLSFSVFQPSRYIVLYQNYINDLVSLGIVDRKVEFLPDDKTLLERKVKGISLTRPELAVLLAYTKIHIKNELLKTNLDNYPFLDKIVANGFPDLLRKKYREAMDHHYLRNEIIATQLSNRLVNEMGITFAYRMQIETGATIAEIIRAQMAASVIFDAPYYRKLVESLDFKIPIKKQYELLHHIRQLLNLASRWLLHQNRLKGNIEEIILHYQSSVQKIEKFVPRLMSGITRDYLQQLKEEFSSVGISTDIGERIAASRALYLTLNIIEVSTRHKFDLEQATKVYFSIGTHFNLVWFRDQISLDTHEGHWNTIAVLTLRDELDILQRNITKIIMKHEKLDTADNMILSWLNKHPRVKVRWGKILELFHANPTTDFAMFFIALKELGNLIAAV